MLQFARGGRNPVGDKKLLLLAEFRGPKSYRRAVQVSEETLPAWHGANRASFRARAPRVAGSLHRQKNGDSSGQLFVPGSAGTCNSPSELAGRCG
jgi:hypothetical protein